MKITDGVDEKGWGQPFNICKSDTRCKNGCLYCYFLLNHQLRFKRISKDKSERKSLKVDNKKILKGIRKRSKRQMFPTSHDIFPFMIIRSRIMLRKLLKSNNKVLIVSKARIYCIKKLIELFEKEKYSKYKENIEFRITITSYDNQYLKFWEPKAPLFNERIECIKLLIYKGFRSSISIEPYLDNPFDIITYLDSHQLISKIDTIWIGKMNYLSRIKSDYFYKNKLSILETESANHYFKHQEHLITLNYVFKIIRVYNRFPAYIQDKIIFKDSIFNFLKKNKLNIKTMDDIREIHQLLDLTQFMKEEKEVVL